MASADAWFYRTGKSKRRNWAGPATTKARALPARADGKAEDLLGKVKSIRELAESFNRKSGALMEEGRRSLFDVRQAAIKLTRKFDPLPATADNPAPPRRPAEKRQ